MEKVYELLLFFMPLFIGTHGVCSNKPAMANYTNNLLVGKYYAIAVRPGFAHLYNELTCDTATVLSANTEPFLYTITTQNANRTTSVTPFSARNVSPGVIDFVGGGVNITLSVIAAIPNKLHLYYGCNPKDGDYAAWIYYYKRVQGVNNLDPEALSLVHTVFNRENIPLNGLTTENNTNCTD